MPALKKETQEALEIGRSYGQIHEAAEQMKQSVLRIRRLATGSFVTPEIDKGLTAAIKLAEDIRQEATAMKATNYMFNLKNA